MSKIGKLVLFIVIIICISFNLIGFIYINNLIVHNNAAESQYNNLLSEVQQLKTEVENEIERNEVLTEKLEYLKQISDRNNLLIKEQISLINLKENSKFLSENTIIPIYSANIDTYNQEIIFYTYFSKELTLKEKLNTIGNKLSLYCFNRLPIEVQEIKNIENKKIAVINLQESMVNQEIDNHENWIGKSWASNYFQGSTGGIITSTELIETFLQRSYTDDWIDGVKFLYKGSNIEFEHVFILSDTIYR